MGLGEKIISKKFQDTIKNLIKEKRLSFIGENKVSYTNRQGETQELSVSGMADILIRLAGFPDELGRLGITNEKVSDMIITENSKLVGNKRRLLK